MSTQPKKFKIKLNLFDFIVLAFAGLVAAGLIAFLIISHFQDQAKLVEGTYTIRLQGATPEIVDMIQVGDELENAITNVDIGTVVSFTYRPTLVAVLDEETLTFITQEQPDYIDVDIVVSAPYSLDDDGDEIFLESGYQIRCSEYAYVRGPGYLGSGPVIHIDREGLA